MSLYTLVLYSAAAVAFMGCCCRLAHAEHVKGIRGHAIIGGLVLIALGLVARVLGMPTHAALLVSIGLALFFVSERREVSR